MKGFVYLLKDQNGRFYIGSTVDVARRLAQHKNGHTQTTRNMVNPVLVLAQEYESLEVAKKVEKKIKKLKRKDYLERMVQDGKINIYT